MKNFAENYTQTGYNIVLNKSGIKSGSINQVKATAFILRVLQEHPEYKNSITGFEEKIETINDAGETNTAFADIIQNGNKIIECKSWALDGIAFQKFVEGSSGSVAQFKTYLSDQVRITSMDNIEYWFDGKKGITETQVKEKFKAMMYENDVLTQAGSDVFDAIWGNTGLRNSLFGPLDYSNPNPSIPKQQGKNVFESIVKQMSSNSSQRGFHLTNIK